MYNELKEKLYVDFDESMGKGSGYFRAVENYTGQPRITYQILKDLYEKNNFLKVTPQERPRIPKIIHQMWIGTRPIPPVCEEYRKTWIKHHPDWEYKLWTDREVATYQFADPNLEYLFKKSDRIGEKVDIWRYDILYRFGGLYVDVDCKCFQPLDLLHHCYDFYAGIINPLPQFIIEDAINICNAAIGSKPGHPVFKKIGEILLERWDSSKIPEDAIYTIIHRTYVVLTHGFLAVLGKDDSVNIALPASYFYPIMPLKSIDYLIRGPKEIFWDWLRGKPGPFSTEKPHSFIHHDSQRQWFYDSFSTVTYRGKMWLGFNFKEWGHWAKTKLKGRDEKIFDGK